MTSEYKRQSGESEEEFIYRVCSAKDLIGSWQDVADIINEQLGYEYTESKYRKQYQAFQRMFEANREKISPCGEYADLQELKRELQKERVKLQTEKSEYARWIREEARDDLIVEKVVEAIRDMPPVKIPDFYKVHLCGRSAILAFGDEHYGAEFKINGLHGEVINEYSPEIFERRMWELQSEVFDLIEKENISVLNVYSLGDFADGILRCEQLRKLRYGVIESTVRYANFIAEWLNKLTERVIVKYQMTYGNHTELRLIGQPKGAFKEENTGLFVREIIATRLENNLNFFMVKNPTGLIYDEVSGFKVLGIHGEVSNMENAINQFSNTYKTPIDVLIGGHMHHYKSETVGRNREVINVPSIVGIDDYAMQINKTSNPGATLLLLEEARGIVTEHHIKLD
nr:MAG TPA: DNA polymerase II small subunit [Caudoviricetes sp.]